MKRTRLIAGRGFGRSRHQTFANIVASAQRGMPTQRSIRRMASTLMPVPVTKVLPFSERHSESVGRQLPWLFASEHSLACFPDKGKSLSEISTWTA